MTADAVEQERGGGFDGALHHVRCGDVESDGAGQRVAVGEVDEAESDEADEHLARVEAAAEGTVGRPGIEQFLQVGEHGAFGHGRPGLAEVRSALEVFPKQEADELRVVAQELEVQGDQIAHGPPRGGARPPSGKKLFFTGADPLVGLPEHGAVNALLAAEVMVDHALVHAGGVNDLVHRDPVVAAVGEQVEGDGEQTVFHSRGARFLPVCGGPAAYG